MYLGASDLGGTHKFDIRSLFNDEMMRINAAKKLPLILYARGS